MRRSFLKFVHEDPFMVCERNPAGSYLQHNAAVEEMLPKADPTTLETTMANIEFQMNTFRWIRPTGVPAQARILDYGCGSGDEVSCLVQAGYDAYGVDILEYWGKDRHLHGQALDGESREGDDRLRVIDPATSLLPFADGFFDLVVSEQVMEHVFDLERTFREQARVLKPGGMGIHRMPSPTSLMEVHTGVPIVALNRYRWYLAAWAISGRRNARQHGLNWRETLASNQDLFGTTNYVSRDQMLGYARHAGLKARFLNDYFSFGKSRLSRLYRKLERIGLAKFAVPALVALSSAQILIVEKPD
jgi:SAM-dependent methyltransferase